MRTLIPLFALLFAGCGPAVAPVKTYADNAPAVRLAVVVDQLDSRAVQPAPGALADALRDGLRARKLATTPVAHDKIRSQFKALRDTNRRLAFLHADGTVVALAELQAEFYSSLNGQNRWTLHVSLSVGEAGRSPLIQRFTLPVVLYPHQQEPDVYTQAAEELSRRLGRLVDDYLSGRAVSPSAAVKRPGPAAGRLPKTLLPHEQGLRQPTGSLYFVLVDRFHNGDPKNDGPGTDSEDPNAWHGGDLAGVTARLDHLAALGVDTLWLSPIFETRAEPWHGHGAFHGYWTYDLERIDPRFGDEGDLARLMKAADARGIDVLLDLVVNHVGYDAPRITQRPDWFNPAKTIEDWDDPVQLTDRQVHGLPDLNQTHAPVAEHLTRAALHWAARSDGFRLDAVKHVPLPFWAQLNGQLTAKHPGHVLLGELFDGDPRKVDATRRDGRFTHMLDFPMAFALRDVFCGGQPVGRIGEVLGADRLYEDPASTLVTFVDNHDLPRILSLCKGDRARAKQVLTALYAMRGKVSLTYGTEAALEGEKEPDNRGDMVFTGPVVDELSAHITRLQAARRAHPELQWGTSRVVRMDADTLVVERQLGQRVTRVTIDAGTVRFEPLPPRPPEPALPVTVMVTATASLNAGEQLMLVGSAPEVGLWQVEQGLALTLGKDGRHVGRLTLPEHTVAAYKLVILPKTGAPRWEQRANRYVHATKGLELTPSFGRE